jgi:hypothetical protein
MEGVTAKDAAGENPKLGKIAVGRTQEGIVAP